MEACEVLFFSARIDANRPFVEDGDMLTETAAEDSGEHGEPENHEIEDNRDGRCHEMAALLQGHGRIRDEERMHEVSKVGMASELMQDGIEPAGIFLVRENREEEDARRQRVEKAGRAQLMGRVDGLKRRVARFVNQLVVISEQPEKRRPEKHRDGAAVLTHERLEFLDMDRQIAAEYEDKHVMDNPVIQAVHEEWLEPRVVGQAVNEGVERHGKARPVVKGNLCDE